MTTTTTSSASPTPATRRRPRSLLAVLVVSLLGSSGLLLLAAGPAGADNGFVQLTVNAGASGDCKATADVNRDGRPDLVVGGSSMSWYRNPATTDLSGTWLASPIANAQIEFTTDCQAADVDGDGDADIVVPDASPSTGSLLWFENRVPAGLGWVRHVITATAGYRHDIEVADLNGDGKVDVVGRRPGSTMVWTQGSTPDTWTARSVSTRAGEGLAVGDVDDDGDIDVVTGGYWLANPTWASTTLVATDWGSPFVADIDGDSRHDVVLCPMESTGNQCTWHGRPAGATGWTSHLIAGGIGAGHHQIEVADMDRDGDLDVIAPKMHTFGGAITMYRQTNPNVWLTVQIGTGGAHNVRLADFDLDGDPDVVAVNFIGAAGARVLRNDLVPPASTTTSTSTTTTSSTTTSSTTSTTAPPSTTTTTTVPTTTTTVPTTTTTVPPSTTTTVPTTTSSTATTTSTSTTSPSTTTTSTTSTTVPTTTTSTTTPPASVRYEAEAASYPATVKGNDTMWCPCSGNRAVGDFREPGEYVMWTVNAPTAGSYRLTWRFAAGAGATGRQLTVNSAIVRTISFPTTSTWPNWQLLSTTVNLPAGPSTVKLLSTTWTGAAYLNLDYVDVARA